MTKTKFSIILDSFFITFLVFIILYIWLNKYLKNAIYSFILCIFISFIIFFAIFKHFLKKFNIKNLKSKDLKFADKCFKSLLFSDNKSNVTFFEKLLEAKQISNNIYKNDFSFFYLSLPVSALAEVPCQHNLFYTLYTQFL